MYGETHFWQSDDAILEDVSVTETIVWHKIINLNTIIQVKSCTKHGRPNQS